jgi:hypothetical protein
VNEPSEESPERDARPRIARTPSNSLSCSADAQNFERSVAELSDARRALNTDDRRETWAEVTVTLGDRYARTRVGTKSKNLKLAIECYDAGSARNRDGARRKADVTAKRQYRLA